MAGRIDLHFKSVSVLGIHQSVSSLRSRAPGEAFYETVGLGDTSLEKRYKKMYLFCMFVCCFVRYLNQSAKLYHNTPRPNQQLLSGSVS